ncbi:MAG: SDR family oxidoreductase [Stellaceae bacterium]
MRQSQSHDPHGLDQVPFQRATPVIVSAVGDARAAAATADTRTPAPSARSRRSALAKPAYFEDYVRHGFPMGRLGTAEEVADVIVFIASPRAHWINGRNIPVDGLEQPHAPLDRRPY